MKVSAKGIAELISHEAIVTSPYKDSVGVWTIGVGHTKGAGAPDPAKLEKGAALPVAELIDLFRKDLAKYEADVSAAFVRKPTQEQFDAAVSFHFNTGAIKRATWVKRFNEGNLAGAARGMLDWNKPPEIMGRRKAEEALFRAGVYSNDGHATIYPATVSGAVQWSKGRRVKVSDLIEPIAEKAVPQGGVIYPPAVVTTASAPANAPSKAPKAPSSPPHAAPAPAPAEPAKEGFWSRFWTAFTKRTSA